MNSKGVSPLIATVLLVMIVVSIGAAVMVVIQSISEDNLATVERQGNVLKCAADVDTEIYQVDGSPRICIDGDNISMTMENTGLRDIESWRLIVVGNDISDTLDTTNVLNEGSIQTFTFDYNESQTGPVSSIQAIELRPRLPTGGNAYTTCNEPNLVWQTSAIEDWVNCSDSGVTWDD